MMFVLGYRGLHGKRIGELRTGEMAEALRLDRGQIEVVDDAMAEALRHKTPAERIRIGFTMWTFARNMLMSHLKKTHPEWSTEMIEKEIAGRLSKGLFELSKNQREKAFQPCSS